MQYSILESLLSNISFALLFLLMVYFFSNTGSSKRSMFLRDTSPLALSSPAQPLPSLGSPLLLGKVGMLLSNISLASLLLLRWLESNHFPLSNLYESLIFLSWSFTLIYLVLDKVKPNPFIGSIIAPTALLTSSFATFSLPEDMQKISPLVPALQSNWLMMHVTVMILSYAALIAGSLLAILFLFFGNDPDNLFEADSSPLDKTLISETSPDQKVSSTFALPARFEWSKTIDNLSYRSLSIGFCFLTIGIISGAVWANEAWGSYWSWDPKETWALITWLVFATYLHIRLKYGWEGKKPALIASGGFFVIWVCYLGVNLFGKGLHTYGFWN
jgi:cytochrome c-type biogenesis protein CcsB